MTSKKKSFLSASCHLSAVDEAGHYTFLSINSRFAFIVKVLWNVFALVFVLWFYFMPQTSTYLSEINFILYAFDEQFML